MPKKKRCSGFTYIKKGAQHNARGKWSRRRPTSGSEDHSQNTSSHQACEEPHMHEDSSGLSDRLADHEIRSDLCEVIISGVSISAQGPTSLSDTTCEEPCLRPSSMSASRNEELLVIPANSAEEELFNHVLGNEPNITLIHQEVLDLFSLILPNNWKAVVGRQGFHLVCFSRCTENIAVQREVFASFRGEIKVFVHRKLINDFCKENLNEVCNTVALTAATTKAFVDRIWKIIQELRMYEICAWVDQSELETLWSEDESGCVDNNPYAENRYVKSFRTHSCAILVPVAVWRCKECSKAASRLKKKLISHQDDQFNVQHRNSFLDKGQMLRKLKEQRKELKNARRKVDYLSNKFAFLIQTEGVNLDRETSEILSDILRESKLTPLQQLFIQQQYKFSTLKGATDMRWHPTIIRFALLIKSTSSGAYSDIVNSGLIKLPSERTLSDYEHAVPRKEGVFKEKLVGIEEKVQKLKEHQQYHVLMMDEIHISQTLVYRKSDGSLVGYVKLSEVEAEMKSLMDSLNNGTADVKPSVATKILTYMIKGCTSSVKEAVAAFPTASLTKEQLFDRTWEVIRACEGRGVKILAVCDGSSVNRYFIDMHTPFTKTASNIVFDTVNLCAFDRILYFISDPPHLIKTIRNCFAKSGFGPKHTRLLKKNGEFIVWETIVRLYKEDMHSNLRRSYKLNSQNVYLNSYTCMKVSFAAQVLSKTVGLDLKSREWPKTSETVQLNLKVNDFFDDLNGAHTTVATKTANPRLQAYRDGNDARFKELKGFEQYLSDWEDEVKNLRNVSEADKGKMTLSRQTVEGICMTVNGFSGAVKFLLSIGANFVNGRVFCQDPLEQYFGKQRASGGGRINPTVESFMNTDAKISIYRDYNVRKRSGNCETFTTAMDLCDAPMPKRRTSL